MWATCARSCWPTSSGGRSSSTASRSSTSRTSPTWATCATSDRPGGDRMLVAARSRKDTAEIADSYEAAFHADGGWSTCCPRRVPPRDRAHPRDDGARERLADVGRAYGPGTGPSTTTSARSRLRALSGNTWRSCGRPSRRGEPDKRDAADFALWKTAERGREMKWPIAVGRGLPGLAPRVLRDVAGGTSVTGSTSTPAAIDNVFPHHEDEIAQSVGGHRQAPRAPPGCTAAPADVAAARCRSRPATSSASPSWLKKASIPSPSAT